MKILNRKIIGNKMINFVTEYFDSPSITKMANTAYMVISNPKIQSLKPKFNCKKVMQIIAKKWRPSYLSLFKKNRSFPL
ncbi:hypothetical protein A8L44_00585 [Bacillus sp. FJAT-27986]|nr:hypothetical protein A8L44_00585 [Bacillus sp. FJAT-27986]